MQRIKPNKGASTITNKTERIKRVTSYTIVLPARFSTTPRDLYRRWLSRDCYFMRGYVAGSDSSYTRGRNNVQAVIPDEKNNRKRAIFDCACSLFQILPELIR